MQCTHVKADGIRCGSPALRGEAFCYFHFHNADHRPRRDAKVVDIPFPENAQCIQVGLYNVMQAVVERKIDEKRARLLIWSLQVAAGQTSTLRFDSSMHQSKLVTELPEYERVQRETAKADREFVANWQAEAQQKEGGGEGGEDPTVALPAAQLGGTWGTQEGTAVIAPSPAGKGAAPVEVEGAEGEEAEGAAPVEVEGAEGEEVEGAAPAKVEGAEGEEAEGEEVEGAAPAEVEGAEDEADSQAETLAGIRPMTRGQMEDLIERAVSGDWESAQKLFREAGLMPAS